MPSTIQTPSPIAACRPPAAVVRPHWVRATVLAASLALVVVALEAIFYFAGIGDQEYLRPDATTGYSPMAGKHVTWRKEGFSRAVFNSWGMRDRELTIEKPRDTFRIAFLGDSFVEALQVERERSFVARVEAMLNERGYRPRVEAMNFGVSAYNLGQMHLRLKDLAVRFQPDLVVVCLRSDTTLLLAPNPQGGFIYARPTFFVGTGRGVVADYTVQSLFYRSGEGKRMRRLGWLREHSRIWGVVSNSVAYLVSEYGDDWDRLQSFARSFLKSGRLSAPELAPPAAVFANPIDQENLRKATLYLWPTADALLQAMTDDCARHGSHVAFLRLPGQNGQHNLLEASLMKRSAERLHVPYIDLNPAFAAATTAERNLFFTFHMDDFGHELAARELSNALQDRHLVPDAAESGEK